jgi:hypothetical protein
MLLLTLNTLGDGQQDAGHEGFTVVILLEDLDLLSKTRAIEPLATLWSALHGP